MSAPYNRPATNPGGMECQECGVIFIGEEWHIRCAVCERKAQRRADRVGGEVYATTVMVSLADGFKAPVIQVSARAA